MKLNSINNIRVLEKFLQEPEKWITYDDYLHDLRLDTGESEIGGALRFLKNKNILRERKGVGRPLKRERSRYKSYKNLGINEEIKRRIDENTSDEDVYKRTYFEIVEDLRTFEILLPIYVEENTEILLGSKFTDDIIKFFGFYEVYGIIYPYLERMRFRDIASRSLLNLPATTKYYYGICFLWGLNMFKEFRQYKADKDELLGEDSHQIPIRSDLKWEPERYRFITQIALLSHFDQIEAVKLCRRTIHEHLKIVYSDLATMSILPESICKFLTYDSYLSPLTSYPIYGFKVLIFSGAFERIIGDSYLIEGDKIDCMISRAHIIYDNFPDFMVELFKNNPLLKERMETVTREFIFHWNVASTRFDYICNYYINRTKENANPGNFHLHNDGVTFKLSEFKKEKSTSYQTINWDALGAGSIPIIFESQELGKGLNNLSPRIMDNPFTCLKPCRAFEIIGGRSDFIQIKEILKDIKYKMGKLS